MGPQTSRMEWNADCLLFPFPFHFPIDRWRAIDGSASGQMDSISASGKVAGPGGGPPHYQCRERTSAKQQKSTEEIHRAYSSTVVPHFGRTWPCPSANITNSLCFFFCLIILVFGLTSRFWSSGWAWVATATTLIFPAIPETDDFCNATP